ncbi:MAG TPA: FHA domain-containing protein [Polyangiaceae bacterium]|nr:FHA domain-containing protein [Polyangiaceae bacterium]
MSNSPSVPPQGSSRPSLVNELDEALGEIDIENVPTVFLVGLSGRLAGKLYKIRPGRSIIGRSSQAYITLDERAVSHKHASLLLSENGCQLEDLESTNGTFLNDVKVTAPQVLHAGDVIRIASHALGFLTDAEDEQQHTRAMARLTAPRMTSSLPSASSAPIVPVNQTNSLVVHSPQATSMGGAQLSIPVAVPEPDANPVDVALDKLELIWTFAVKNWRKLTLATSIGAVAGLGLGLIQAPMSYAQFEIYLRQDATPDPTRQQQEGLAIQGGEFFTFAERKFTEPTLVQKTLADLGGSESRLAAVATATRLAFSPVDRRGTFRGTYSDYNPRYTERFLAAHLQNFLEAEINKSLTVQASEVELMRREYEKNEALLAEVEKTLRSFKEKHLSALPEQAMSQIQNRGILLTQRDRLTADVLRYQAELTLAKSQLDSGDALAATKVTQSKPYDDALSQVKQQIAAAQAKGYAEGHPELQQLREEQRRLESLKGEALSADTTELDRKTNLEYQRLKDRVGAINVSLTTTQKELAQVHGRLSEIDSLSGKMPEVEAELTRLTRTQASAKEIHERLNFELKHKELQLQFERASVAARYEVIQVPHVTVPPRWGRAVKFGAMGTGAGLGIGVVWALVSWVITYARQRKVKVTPPVSTSLQSRPQ